VTFGAAADVHSQQLETIDHRMHPDFRAVGLENDLAVLVLPDAVPSKPLALSALPAEVGAGASIRLVGFGRSSAEQMSNAPAEKQTGIAIIGELTESKIVLRAGPSQPCIGDSGGPVLAQVAQSESIVAVTSSGDARCADYAKATRVDADAGFLRDAISAMNA